LTESEEASARRHSEGEKKGTYLVARFGFSSTLGAASPLVPVASHRNDLASAGTDSTLRDVDDQLRATQTAGLAAKGVLARARTLRHRGRGVGTARIAVVGTSTSHLEERGEKVQTEK
jgi:hypothetical protein